MKKLLLLTCGLIGFLYGVSQNGNEKAFHYISDTTYLPDGTGDSYTTTILVSGYSSGEIVNTVNDFLGVCVNMEHSYLGDLTISLTCPNDTTVVLENQGGGGTYLGVPLDYDPSPPGTGWDYCWNPTPTYGIMNVEASNYSTLPSGSYTSFEPLSNLIGCPLNGPWTITITDNWTIDDGYIFNWSINFLQDIVTTNPIVYNKNEIKVYPNPVNTSVTFEVDEVPFNIEIYSLIGKKVMEVSNVNSSIYTADRDNFSNGIYIYKISNSEELIGSGKLIFSDK